MNDEILIKEAQKAMEYSYSPYSNFKVGAALLCKNGKIYKGCNIENASFSATVCAERTAIFKAVSEGEKDGFVCLAIVSSGEDFPYPCGVCRQVFTEFMKDAYIIVANKKGEYKKFTIEDLMPYSFTEF